MALVEVRTLRVLLVYLIVYKDFSSLITTNYSVNYCMLQIFYFVYCINMQVHVVLDDIFYSMETIEGDDVAAPLLQIQYARYSSTTAEDCPKLIKLPEDIKQRQNNYARMCMLINREGRF